MEQCSSHLGGLLQALVTTIAIDDGEDVGGADVHLRALVVAGGCAYAADGVAYDRHALYVERSAAYALEGLLVLAYPEAEVVARDLVGIESADAISRAQGHQVDEVHQRVYPVQLESAQQAAAQSLGRRAISAGVLAAGAVGLAGSRPSAA